ncbi:MAG: hypothetical protein ACTSUO_02825 [Candidatus Thorarchaeota archaeon]
MQKKNSLKAIVLYGILPLLLVTLMIPVIIQTSSASTNDELRTLDGYPYLKYPSIIPVGIMTPETSGTLKNEYDVVYDVLDGLNDEYGPHLSIYRKVGSYASESGLRYLLKYTERTHISSHGQYHSTYKSGIELSDGYIYASDVNYWSISSPQSDLLFLSACQSLGYSSHTESTLASTICSKSSVDMVIGYNDVVDAYSAMYIAHKFWWFLTRAAEPYGGFNGQTSFNSAITAIAGHIAGLEAAASFGAAAVVAAAFAAVLGPVGVLVGAFLGELAEQALQHMIVGDWIELQEDTKNALEYYGESNVPELVWTGGGDPWGDDWTH